MLRIRWRGQVYLFVGEELTHGPITTAARYREGVVSNAHLMPSGEIMCWGRVVGDRRDIEVLGPAKEPVPTNAGVARLMLRVFGRE